MADKDKKFSEGFLFSGKDLKLSEGIYVKHPTIENILSFTGDENSFSIYYSLASLLMCDPYEYMVMLDDMGFDYSTQDYFDVFLMQWKRCWDNYKANPEIFEQNHILPVYNIVIALCFFLGEHKFDIQNLRYENGEVKPVIVDLNSIKDNKCNYIIDRNMFNRMAEFISAINCVDKSKQLDLKKASYRKLYIKQQRDELRERAKKKTNDSDYGEYIGNIMRAVCFCGNGSISVFNVNQCHIYPLLKGFNMFIKKDNVDHLMNGQYDLSKISKKELDWFE